MVNHRLILWRICRRAHDILPIMGRPVAEITMTPRHLTAPYVFCTPDGCLLHRIDRVFRSVVTQSGVTGLHLDDLRYTFVTQALRRGVPDATLRQR